jgi:Lrp/AsnC family transcriptional regulator, leucine-responsive regulatory protein
MPKTVFLDAVDRQLLMELQADSRPSYQELGSKVGLSTSATNERVRKLFNEKVTTGCHARVNPKLVGLEISALVSVTIDTPRHETKLLQRINETPEVQECHHITGEFSYLLKVHLRNTDHLEHLLTDVIKAIKGVTKTNTTIILSSPKDLPIVNCLEDVRRPSGEGD